MKNRIIALILLITSAHVIYCMEEKSDQGQIVTKTDSADLNKEIEEVKDIYKGFGKSDKKQTLEQINTNLTEIKAEIQQNKRDGQFKCKIFTAVFFAIAAFAVGSRFIAQAMYQPARENCFHFCSKDTPSNCHVICAGANQETCHQTVLEQLSSFFGANETLTYRPIKF